jgi:MYXO-CTERM domain-containing protein
MNTDPMLLTALALVALASWRLWDRKRKENR